MSQKYMVVIHLRDNENEIEIKHYHVDKVKNISKILKTYADYIVHIKYNGVNQETNYIKKEDIKEHIDNLIRANISTNSDGPYVKYIFIVKNSKLYIFVEYTDDISTDDKKTNLLKDLKKMLEDYLKQKNVVKTSNAITAPLTTQAASQPNGSQRPPPVFASQQASHRPPPSPNLFFT